MIMVNLEQIKTALSSIEGGTEAEKYIDEAIDALKSASGAMGEIAVKGRENIDALFGCMIGIDLVIGGKQDGR